MSHVDEGALHAYLDGALDEYPAADASRIREHLDQCAECAERLEVERRIRSDAHAVLAMAAPDVDLPSLEDLRAYVARTRPQRSAASTRMIRMGWAASVALALGTGYVLRDGQLALQAPMLDSDAISEAEATQARGPSEAAEADDVASFREGEGAPERDLVASVGVEEDEGQARAGQRSVAESEALGSTAVAARREAVGGGVGRVEDGVSTDVVANRAGNEPPAAQPAPDATIERFNDSAGSVVASADVLEEATTDQVGPAEVLAPADLMDSLRQSGAELPRNALADAGALPEVESPPAESVAEVAGAAVADPASEPASDEDRAARRRSDSPVAVTSALEASGAGGFAAKAEDGDLESLPATAVPGLEIIEVSGIGEGTTFLGTHTTQRLGGGGVLNVYHLEVEVEPSVLPEPAAGENEVMLETEAGWVILRGPAGEAELRELLERLLPEG